MALEALIFDVDGTLAETEELHRQAFNETFAKAGLGWHWTRSDYRCPLTTTGGKERIARYMGEIGVSPDDLDIPALHRAKTLRYTELIDEGRLTLRDGVAKIIEQARLAGLKLAIATTTSRPNVDALCAATFSALPEHIFSAIACGDEVTAKKPAPDVYELALARLGIGPERAIAFEDSRNGLRSATGARIACIVTPSAYTEGEDFSCALRVVDSMLDVAEDLATLMQPVS